MPKVRGSDGFIVRWNRQAIVKQLLTETKLAKEFLDIQPISQEEAEEIAYDVERKIINLRLKFVSGPLVRELVNNVLLSMSKDKPRYAIYRNILTRVGAPVFDAYLMDVGQGFKANENANLQPNAETSHKRKADWVSGEEYLLLMPPKLADAHLSGDLHIHDLEYFGTRPFCQDWDLRYFFYYGFNARRNGNSNQRGRSSQTSRSCHTTHREDTGFGANQFRRRRRLLQFPSLLSPVYAGS